MVLSDHNVGELHRHNLSRDVPDSFASLRLGIYHYLGITVTICPGTSRQLRQLKFPINY